MTIDKKDPQFGADGTFTIPEVTIQPYPTIKKGSRGPTVAKWQRMIGVEADGNFGSQTDAATKKWQSDHSITPDGVVGVQTWAKMLEATSPTGMLALEWNEPSPEIPSPPAPATVIPPVPGAVPLGAAPSPGAKTGPATVKAVTTAGVGGGFFDWIGKLPTWGKVLLGGAALGGVVASAKDMKKKGH